jgi:hypothetical protein
LASRPHPFTPGERAPSTSWIVGWVGPRSRLDPVAKRKNPSSCLESNPGSPTLRYIDKATVASEEKYTWNVKTYGGCKGAVIAQSV